MALLFCGKRKLMERFRATDEFGLEVWLDEDLFQIFYPYVHAVYDAHRRALRSIEEWI